MSAVAPPPAAPAIPLPVAVVTPDDLLRMPDEGRGYELVDGQLKEMTVSAKSCRVGAGMVRRLWNFSEDRHPGWVFQSDGSFKCFPDDPNRVRRADAAFITLDRFTPEQYEQEGHITVCPDLVVEVVSPNDIMEEVTRKRREWLVAGVRLVWVIDPEDQSVTAYPAGGRPVVYQTADTLAGDPVLPGFAVPVADLFRLPAPPAAG